MGAQLAELGEEALEERMQSAARTPLANPYRLATLVTVIPDERRAGRGAAWKLRLWRMVPRELSLRPARRKWRSPAAQCWCWRPAVPRVWIRRRRWRIMRPRWRLLARTPWW